MNTTSVGKTGEERACDYIRNLGFSIMFRNFRSRFGEIDIIARDAKEIVFIEVKTRSGLEHGLPEEAINRHKILKITKTIYCFFSRYPQFSTQSFRIDAVTILNTEGKCILKHYKSLG